MENLEVLQTVAEGLDFHRMCAAALDTVAERAEWPERRAFRIMDNPSFSTQTRLKTLAETGTEGLLIVRASGAFAPRARALKVNAKAVLYLGTGSRRGPPAYNREFVYVSDPVEATDVDSAVAEWAKEDAARFRATVATGVEEIAAMIAADFFARHGAPDESAGAERFEYTEQRLQANPRAPEWKEKVHWTGKILSEREGRLIVRRNNGNMYAIPVEFRRGATVFEHGDFRFDVSYRPEPRVSVHAHHPTGEAKIWLSPEIELAQNDGLSRYKVTEVLKLARQHETEIRSVWENLHGGDPDR